MGQSPAKLSRSGGTRRRSVQLVIRHARTSALGFEAWTQARLRAAVYAPAYPLMVGAIALILTMSMTVPFASVLFTAVLLRRRRWPEIVLWSSIGSATGGLILYLVFHHLGANWSQLIRI
jgi:hypothetical protein